MAGPDQRGTSEGPVLCGTADEISNGEALPRMCAIYCSGFRADQTVYPYLTARTA
jgi:hypothetical protein